VLCQVGKRPGTTPGELAAALELTRGAVSRIIDKLEAKNWIARSARPGDNRVQLLSLTRRGDGILPRLAEIADRSDLDFFAGLATDERVILRRLLGKLAQFHQIGDVPID